MLCICQPSTTDANKTLCSQHYTFIANDFSFCWPNRYKRKISCDKFRGLTRLSRHTKLRRPLACSLEVQFIEPLQIFFSLSNRHQHQQRRDLCMVVLVALLNMHWGLRTVARKLTVDRPILTPLQPSAGGMGDAHGQRLHEAARLGGATRRAPDDD